jgi:hypothetical protein
MKLLIKGNYMYVMFIHSRQTVTDDDILRLIKSRLINCESTKKDISILLKFTSSTEVATY